MKTLGRIVSDGKRLVIDAEPHVMRRVRALFENGQTPGATTGIFTHKPVAVPDTLATARDLVWLTERYPLEMVPELRDRVVSSATRYDTILAAVSNADKDESFRISPEALPLALPLRPHQAAFRNMVPQVGGRILLADRMGLGKTASAISLLCEPGARPALVVTPATICTQWKEELARFLPGAVVHIIKGHKVYDLPPADVYVTAYNRRG